MTGSPLVCAASISDLMYSRATQASSPQEVRQRLIDSRIGSGRSPQNPQWPPQKSSAGRFPNPARAPTPPAANTALSRSVRNLSQIRSFIEIPSSVRHRTHNRPFRFATAGIAAGPGQPIGLMPLQFEEATLRVHPNDGILRAMLLRLLF